MVERSKSLKVVLKSWNKYVFGNRKVYASEVESRSRAIVNLWSLLRIKDSQLVQRSRSKWIKKGDSSLSYFHTSINIISRRNIILPLKVREVWIEGVSITP